MKIKKGDNVIVIAGKYKGEKGKVLKVFPDISRVMVEGVGKIKRHMRARTGNEKGSILEIEAPIHISNVQVVDAKSGKRSRVGFKVIGTEKTRIAKKSGQELK